MFWENFGNADSGIFPGYSGQGGLVRKPFVLKLRLESVDKVIIRPQNKRREIRLTGVCPATTAETLNRNRENQHIPISPVA